MNDFRRENNLYTDFTPKKVLETPPTDAIITVDEAKLFLKVDDSDDDELIGSMVEAATDRVQAFTNRKLLEQSWSVYWDIVPPFRRIEIPLAPLIEITAVEYLNTSGTYVAVDPAEYEIDDKSIVPAIILFNPLPVRVQVNQSYLNTFHIAGKFGYATADKIPEALKLAAKRMIVTWYDNRSDITVALQPWPTPETAELLMWPHRIFSL